MATAAATCDNVIELDRHPRTWTDPHSVERHFRGKREDEACIDAAARFASAVPPLRKTLPRCWTAPLIAVLPDQPTLQHLQVAVAGAARYFEFLKAQGALDRLAIQTCEYDLLTAAHIVEEMIYAGLSKEAMVFHAQHGATERVRERDERRAASPGAAISGPVSWLGAWLQVERRWIVLWAPAGGSPPVACVEVDAGDRAEALAALYFCAFDDAAREGQAPARMAVFSPAQERALCNHARDFDVNLLPLYRLRCAAPLRHYATDYALG